MMSNSCNISIQKSKILHSWTSLNCFFPVDVDKLLVGAGHAGPADLHAAVSDVLHMEVEVEGKYVREGKRSELQFLSCNKNPSAGHV